MITNKGIFLKCSKINIINEFFIHLTNCYQIISKNFAAIYTINADAIIIINIATTTVTATIITIMIMTNIT